MVPVDLDPESVMRSGPEASAAWVAIGAASQRLDAYVTLWQALHERPAAVDYDGDHWRRVDAQALFDAPGRWHALAADGYRLRLNTWPEAAQLIPSIPVRKMRAEKARRDGFVVFDQARA